MVPAATRPAPIPVTDLNRRCIEPDLSLGRTRENDHGFRPAPVVVWHRSVLVVADTDRITRATDLDAIARRHVGRSGPCWCDLRVDGRPRGNPILPGQDQNRSTVTGRPFDGIRSSGRSCRTVGRLLIVDERLAANRENWNDRTIIHLGSQFYDVERWLREQRGPRPREVDALG